MSTRPARAPRDRRVPRERRMPLREHLREARRRLLLSAAGLLLGAVAGWVLYPEVFELLRAPIEEAHAAHGRDVELNFIGVLTALDMRIKVSFFVGALLSSPWWIYQLWAFVTPGLTRRERRMSVSFLAAGVPLFLAGAALAWWVLPTAVAVLTDFTPQGAENLLDAQGYLTFVMRIILAFGGAFLLPVVMVGLTLLGIVRGRTWLGGWRWAIMLSFVFAAVATPTGDALSFIALGVPVCLLYFGAVGLCLLHDRRVDRRERTQLAVEDAAYEAVRRAEQERPDLV